MNQEISETVNSDPFINLTIDKKDKGVELKCSLKVTDIFMIMNYLTLWETQNHSHSVQMQQKLQHSA